jgi:hypothetical protein
MDRSGDYENEIKPKLLPSIEFQGQVEHAEETKGIKIFSLTSNIVVGRLVQAR